MSYGRTPIGEILLRHEHLRPRELERLIAEPDRKHRLVSMLILRAEIEIDDATLALSEQTGYPGALERHLEQRDAGLVKAFPQSLMKSMGVVPLTRTAAGALVVLARDPSPALADVLRAELSTPIELAVVPAIFIDRLVQRLAGTAPVAGPPSLPEIDRQGPTRHRKTISVLMRAPLDPDVGPPRMSSSSPPATADVHDTSLGMPAVRPPAARTPVIQIPAREDSGARPRPGDGSGANAIPVAPRTISSNTIRRQTGGSAPIARPDGSGPIAREGSGPTPQHGSGPTPRPQRDGSGPTSQHGSGPTPRPQRDGSVPNPRPSESGFETRTPPIGSRGGPPRPPRPPEPEPVLTLDLEDDDPPPPISTTRPTVTLVEPPTRDDDPPPPISTTRPTVTLEPPVRITQPLPELQRRAKTTHPIPNATLQPLLDESEPTPPPQAIEDMAMIESRPPAADVTVSSRPTRPAIIVPTDVIESIEPSERPTKQNVVPPQRATPNIIKRPPTPLPVAPQPSLVSIESEPEPPRDPARAQIRPTYPKLELHPTHDNATVVPRSTDDDWNDFEDAIVTAPPQDPTDEAPNQITPEPEVVAAPVARPSSPPPVPKPGANILRDIERALSRATADRLLMKHAATRWNALLLVNIAADRARGARGHGSRLQAGVESIELAIASSSLLQAACDPKAALPGGKDPLFDLLGNPTSPSSAPIVVDDRVVAVLAAGDAIGGTVDELQSLAGALAVAYQRFPVR